MKNRKLHGLLWITIPFPLLYAFLMLSEHLLETGFLNKKDLGFVGNETGTLYEYLTNVWYWDAFTGILVMLTLFGFITGVMLFRSEKATRNKIPEPNPPSSH